jgi:prepilin-type N-terminal cleavage/methylation domain-containing protein
MVAQRTQRGFTLIELLIVVVIIGILATIAVPRFTNTKRVAQVAVLKADLRNLVTAQEARLAATGSLATTMEELADYFTPSRDVDIEILAVSSGPEKAYTVQATSKTDISIQCIMAVGYGDNAVPICTTDPQEEEPT